MRKSTLFHSVESRVSARFAFGGLKQPVDGFDEAVGLAGLRASDDAIEVIADHGGNVLPGIDLGARDVGAPLSEHCGYDVDLLSVEDVAQLFAMEPRARCALGGELRDQLIGGRRPRRGRACCGPSATPSATL
jgi:hypothetical protein